MMKMLKSDVVILWFSRPFQLSLIIGGVITMGPKRSVLYWIMLELAVLYFSSYIQRNDVKLLVFFRHYTMARIFTSN